MPKLTILIVEDDNDHRALTVRLVKKATPEATLLEAHTAEEAKRFFTGERAIDLVVTDHRLRGSDAAELIRWVREKQSKVIVLAASMYPDARRACLEAGADAFVDKMNVIEWSRLLRELTVRSCLRRVA